MQQNYFIELVRITFEWTIFQRIIVFNKLYYAAVCKYKRFCETFFISGDCGVEKSDEHLFDSSDSDPIENF